MPKVGVLNHPQRAKIDKMIAEGTPLSVIARSVNPPLHRITISRYCNHDLRPVTNPLQHIAKCFEDNDVQIVAKNQDDLQAAMTQVNSGLAAASPFLARLAKLDKYEDFGFSQAVENKKPSEIALMLNAATKRIELGASLSGVLSTPGGAHVQVDARSLTVVVPNGKR